MADLVDNQNCQNSTAPSSHDGRYLRQRCLELALGTYGSNSCPSPKDADEALGYAKKYEASIVGTAEPATE